MVTHFSSVTMTFPFSEVDDLIVNNNSKNQDPRDLLALVYFIIRRGWKWVNALLSSSHPFLSRLQYLFFSFINLRDKHR